MDKEAIIKKHWPKPSQSDSITAWKEAVSKMMDEWLYYQKPDISELSKKAGIKYQTLYRRINVLKWDVSIAVSTPVTTPRAYKKIIKKLSNGNSSR